MARTVKETRAAEAAAAESAGEPRVLELEIGGVVLRAEIPQRWKRFRFMRAAVRNDIATMLDCLWPPAEDGTLHPFIEQLEELDMTEEELSAFMEALASVLVGASAKN